MSSTKDMILSLRGPAIERPLDIPEAPPALSPETQAQLRTLGAAAGLSERRRYWVLFHRIARVFAEQRQNPEPAPVDWGAMQSRKVS